MKSTAPLLLFLPLALSLSACNDSGSGSGDDGEPGSGAGDGASTGAGVVAGPDTDVDTGTGNTVVDGGPAPVVPPSGEVPDTLLDGVWETACLPAPAPATARRRTLSITDTTFTFDDTTYGDAACPSESALRDVVTLGTFVEQQPDDGQRIEDGVPIDLSVDQVTLTPRLLQVAMRYNGDAICGLENWTPGVSQDVSGCNDATGTIDVDTTAPRTDFNLFLVDEGGTPDNTAASRPDDRLLLGTVGSQTDPAARPAMVGREIVFTRRGETP